MNLGFPQRFRIFSWAIIISSLVGLLVLVAIAVAGKIDWSGPNTVDGHIAIFDKGQGYYLDGRSASDRSGMLWISSELAEDLSRGNVTTEQASAIETRLHWLLLTMRTSGMDQLDAARYERIEIAFSNRITQQAQIKDIVDH